MSPRVQQALLGSLAALAAALATTPSAEARPAVSLSAERVNVGSTVIVRVRSRMGAVCVLVARQGGAVQRTARARLRSRRAFWRLGLTQRSAGTWRLRVTCQGDPGAARARLVVRGRRGGGPLFDDPMVPRVNGADDQAGEDRTRAPEATEGEPPIVHQNPMSPGQCVWWAYERRPDIWDRSIVSDEWDAMYWDDRAREIGYQVDHLPAAGAIAVWEPGQFGARDYGHVAYVESVSGDPAAPQVLISDMNGSAGPGQIGQRVLRPEEFGALSYIH